MGFKVSTGSQATGMTTANKAKGQAVEARRIADQQMAEYRAKLDKLAQQSPPPMPQAPAPAAQTIGGSQDDAQQKRIGGQRGSLMAGNTGGYNPATGGSRLGGMMRSLLG